MSILKIKNCLAVVVLLGATGYSMESSTLPSGSMFEDMAAPSSHPLGYNAPRPIRLERDDCSHGRRGSAAYDCDSDNEPFVTIVNEMEGISVATEDKRLELYKMVTGSKAKVTRAEELLDRAHRRAAQAIKYQTEAIRSFAEGASLNIVSTVSVDGASRFFRSGVSASSIAREDREAAELLRMAAFTSGSRVAADLRMASVDASMLVAEETAAARMDAEAAALMRTASFSGSDDEAAAKPAPKKKTHRGHGKKKR